MVVACHKHHILAAGVALVLASAMHAAGWHVCDKQPLLNGRLSSVIQMASGLWWS